MMTAQAALTPLTPLSQIWERGELGSPPPGVEGGGHSGVRLFSSDVLSHVKGAGRQRANVTTPRMFLPASMSA